MTHLARKLRLTDYFTFSFGAMVGVGWLVLMGDWLGREGLRHEGLFIAFSHSQFQRRQC